MHVARYKFSGEAYDRIVDAGFFDDERVELVDGDIIEMDPQKDPHIVAVRRLNRWLTRAVNEEHDVQVQAPIALGASRPEPDLAIVARSSRRATTARLMIEVADTSLAYDTTTKEKLYARHGVSDYWVVNLVDREVWVYTEPSPAGYETIHRYRRDQVARSPEAPCDVDVNALFDEI